jgi:HYR domain-containing protein
MNRFLFARRSARLVVAAAALGLLFVTTANAERVKLKLPPNLTVEAQNAKGAAVLFTATATDSHGTPLPVVCSPAPGSVFPFGVTNVKCTAKETAGKSAEGAFTVTVRDTTAPTLSKQADVTAEATGGAGARLSFTSPTATDTVDGPRPVVCTPASGAVFPLGRNKVECSAQDSRGNIGLVSFAATVRDTTPPVLLIPPAIVISEGDTSGAIAAFLSGATATDLVDSSPVVFNDAPTSFSPGRWLVMFTARDSAGNATWASSYVTILARIAGVEDTRPQAPKDVGGPTVVAAVPDRVPPADVRLGSVEAGDGIISLSWLAPADADFDHVVVLRSSRVGGDVVVYSGSGTTYKDRPVMNGVEYRYVIVSYDRAGNRSSGVRLVALPRALALLAPKPGTVLRPGSRPRLAWRKVRRATYYNVQLYRGMEKVLSAWPSVPRFRLHKEWGYSGRRQTLTAGVYRWYVWPGFGPRSRRRYGALLGKSAFVVAGQRGAVTSP